VVGSVVVVVVSDEGSVELVVVVVVVVVPHPPPPPPSLPPRLDPVPGAVPDDPWTGVVPPPECAAPRGVWKVAGPDGAGTRVDVFGDVAGGAEVAVTDPPRGMVMAHDVVPTPARV
jgi:hypothetical protein